MLYPSNLFNAANKLLSQEQQLKGQYVDDFSNITNDREIVVEEVCLDGTFTVNQLKAIVQVLEKK